MSNEHKAIVSDETIRKWSEGVSFAECVAEEVRDVYEHHIAEGKLRVVEEVEWSKYCSVCDWKLEMDSAYTYCPGCGNKIKRTEQ